MNLAGTLDHDLRCLSCGYNLRGLPTEGSCPECGSSIQTSVDAYAIYGRQNVQEVAREALISLTISAAMVPATTVCLPFFFITVTTLAAFNFGGAYSILRLRQMLGIGKPKREKWIFSVLASLTYGGLAGIIITRLFPVMNIWSFHRPGPIFIVGLIAIQATGPMLAYLGHLLPETFANWPTRLMLKTMHLLTAATTLAAIALTFNIAWAFLGDAYGYANTLVLIYSYIFLNILCIAWIIVFLILCRRVKKLAHPKPA